MIRYIKNDGEIIMGTNEVVAISNKPGEVMLKGFNYIKDRFPNDFEVCLIVEKDGQRRRFRI